MFRPKARDVDHDIVGWEVVQHVAFGHVAECDVAAECHCQTCEHGDRSRVVGDACEAVHGRFAERTIDQKTVVVADKGERNDTDGLEDAAVNQ